MPKPDIVFVVLDTQRADRFGLYGHTGGLSPNLDRWSKQAVIFDQAISCAQWTIPSHAAMFTGLYPTAHQLTQTNLTLSKETPHVAEVLSAVGYDTVGFCNNPLVGVLNNGLKRGFDSFYNYAGTIPNRPESKTPTGLGKFWGQVKDGLRKQISKVERFAGNSDSFLALTMGRWLTPIWSRLGNFKGQNEISVQDVVEHLQERDASGTDKPMFLFLNLMETHLPFFPPQKFLEQVHPEIANSRETKQVMRRWNSEAYRWCAPLAEEMPEIDWDVLNAYYDAEVAYQDSYLQNLFDALAQRENAENTLTIIVGDHGESLGEHDYFGHSFVVYNELVHVPLIMHWPAGFKGNRRVSEAVSTRRLFHTVLQAAGDLPEGIENLNPGEVQGLSLKEVIDGTDVEQGTAYAEAYPPMNFVNTVKTRQPGLIERFKLMLMRRAIVKDGHKLIQVDDEADELFNLDKDKQELNSILDDDSIRVAQLNQQLNRMIGTVEGQRDNLLAGMPLELEQDPELLEHLRGLGYID